MDTVVAARLGEIEAEGAVRAFDVVVCFGCAARRDDNTALPVRRRQIFRHVDGDAVGKRCIVQLLSRRYAYSCAYAGAGIAAAAGVGTAACTCAASCTCARTAAIARTDGLAADAARTAKAAGAASACTCTAEAARTATRRAADASCTAAHTRAACARAANAARHAADTAHVTMTEVRYDLGRCDAARRYRPALGCAHVEAAQIDLQCAGRIAEAIVGKRRRTLIACIDGGGIDVDDACMKPRRRLRRDGGIVVGRDAREVVARQETAL